MDELSRIGITIPKKLLAQFDKFMSRKGYDNRSEAIRDLVRDTLVEEQTHEGTQEVAGTLTLVYDHHVRQLNDRLTGMQHDHFHQIVSTLHIHLDHHNCLEVIVMRGKAGELRHIADKLIAAKGIRHGKLTLTTTAI